MPRIHLSLAGHEIRYDDPTPSVERFLKRANDLVADAEATEDDLTLLVFGADNPILDRTLFPERGMVTKEVLENPVYHVLQDLLARKRAAVKGQTAEQLGRPFTLTVAEAAAQAGVTEDAINKGIRDRRIPSWVKEGRRFLDPRVLPALGLGKRGPLPSGIHPFEFEVGYDAVTNSGMSIKIPSGEFPASQNDPSYDDTCDRWRRVAVRCSSPTGIRVFVLEPGSKKAQLRHHHFYVSGKFDVVQKLNGDKAAREFWKAFKAS